MTQETLAALKKALAKHKDEYDAVAIRVQESPFELGRIDHISHIWDDNDDTGVELDGICASKSIIECQCYYGEHVAILGSNKFEYGEDADEVIMQDAQVLEIVK